MIDLLHRVGASLLAAVMDVEDFWLHRNAACCGVVLTFSKVIFLRRKLCASSIFCTFLPFRDFPPLHFIEQNHAREIPDRI
jgi:hypothetical protein